MKNLTELNKLPGNFQERVFELAEIAKFSRDERDVYEGSLKHYRDNKNTFDTTQEKAEEKGREEGMEIGIEKGMEKTALNSIKAGLDNDTISKITSLTTEQIETLRKNNKSRGERPKT